MMASSKARSVILRNAAKKGDLDSVVTILTQGADINACDKDGWTALHLACFENHPQMALTLIEKGAHINLRNVHGSTPLAWATSKGQKDVVRRLLKEGAAVNAGDWNSNTPLHMAVMFNEVKVAAILLLNGAYVNASNDDGETPLHWAAKNNRVELVQMFLLNGGNKLLKNKSGVTAEDTADPKTIVRQLLEDSKNHSSDKILIESDISENRSLQEQIKVKDIEITQLKHKEFNLRSRLDKKKLEVKQKDHELKRLEKHNAELQLKLIEAQREKESEKKRFDGLNSELQEKLRSRDQRVEELSKMIEYFADSLSKEQTSHLKSRRQVEDMDNQILALQSQLKITDYKGWQIWDDLEEEITCVVCADKLRDPLTLQCGHTFCAECLDKWKKANGKNDCPTCRAKSTGEIKVFILNRLLEKWPRN